MSMAVILAKLTADAKQSDALIADAHRCDPSGASIFSSTSRAQITVSAFLNVFIAWETFLEKAFVHYMLGGANRSGLYPVSFVRPSSEESAMAMLIGTQRFFDFANHENVLKVAKLFFNTGYPFESPISTVLPQLADMRTMRNSSAHISTSTQRQLETVHTRLTGKAASGIDLYTLLMHPLPSMGAAVSVYSFHRDLLLHTADQISA